MIKTDQYLSSAGISLIAKYFGQISILDDLYKATSSVLNVNVRLLLPYKPWPGSESFWYIFPSLISDKEHDGDCLLLITFSIFCLVLSPEPGKEASVTGREIWRSLM